VKTWWKHLRRELEAERDIESAMASLLAKLAPTAELDSLPWKADAGRLRWWLFENLDAAPAPESADHVWFELFTSTWRDRLDACDLKLSGGRESEYFATPLSELTWTPENTLFGSVVLPQLARKLPSGAPELCIAYAALAVQQALRGIDEDLLLGPLHSRGFSVGFENGPGVHLGIFDGEAWDRTELCSY